MKDLKFLFAICAPILLMVLWVGRLNFQVRTGHFVHVAVAGYDPRDLLAGHYLRYRLDFNPLTPCSSPTSQEVCICLTESNSSVTKSVPIWSGECQVRPSTCPAFIRGRCEYSSFVAGVERFYFDENYSDVLMTTPPDSSVMLTTDSSGQAIVLEFLVKGTPIKQYVDEYRQNALATAHQMK